MTFNGKPVPGFAGDFEDVLIYDNRYYFERLITQSSQLEYELQPADKEVTSKLTNSSASENITGYLLTDLLDSLCIEFDSSRSNPKVVKTYPLREKNIGIRLCPEQIIKRCRGAAIDKKHRLVRYHLKGFPFSYQQKT